MGRKSNWSSGETKAIRIPAHLEEQLLEIARKLDSGEPVDFVQKKERHHESVGPYLIGIDDNRYILSGQTLTPDIQEQAESEIDALLAECDRHGLDPRIVFARLCEEWLEPIEQSA